jgi:hypothetical protein
LPTANSLRPLRSLSSMESLYFTSTGASFYWSSMITSTSYPWLFQ